ncbi:MAG: D-alanyl-D-alanine carboxypeptidase [Atopobiaceae bacterium]|jgi:D-alanyl-D-alanine carboxypeptidase (penicillin-binding protein 5/6)|nr:D-alanyl-D-alanine carboxypeptidase [Atopobiaceae bacterium]MCI2173216.1 D-alanyl-D-alanine carboxypeptidase [Atopobiaceae bacterium]MCI2207211.1 D-alanyl-D-alanine carboxypeptidase [Atopobiaceae bacterium]
MKAPKRLLSLLLLTFVLVMSTLSLPAHAFASTSEPDLTEAQSAIVCDDAGNVLWSKDADAEMPMASITKIMTAMVALDSGVSMDTVCQLGDLTLDENAQLAGYKSGTTATFGDLMRVMLVYSANDAATYVAREVAGSEDAFVDLMNQKAQELGMTHTHFKNVHGLEEDGHYSSASDLVIMGRYAMLNYPFIRKMVHTSPITVDVNGVATSFETTDELMGLYDGMLGIKTGAIDGSYTFLGCSSRDGVTLYTAVLGCSTKWGRFQDTENLMDWAYDTYSDRTLASPASGVVIYPFAYHFGYSCVLTADSKTDGMVWPDGEDVTYTKVIAKSGTLTVPSSTLGVCLWTQSGRVVGATSYTTSAKLVRTPSFGPFNSLLFTNLTDAA